jgi:hypothetical protein
MAGPERISVNVSRIAAMYLPTGVATSEAPALSSAPEPLRAYPAWRSGDYVPLQAGTN